MIRAALGFRAPSGWAAVVGVAGTRSDPQVIHRGRIELIERGAKGGVQPYHLARTMKLADAEDFVRGVIGTINKTTHAAVQFIVAELAAKNLKTVACAVVLASGRALPPLEAILRSHAMVHTAEGELFRGAIAHAGEKCGLRISGIKEREIYDQAVDGLHLSTVKLMSRLSAMGKALGPPWTSDEKNATIVAWLALATGVRS